MEKTVRALVLTCLAFLALSGFAQPLTDGIKLFSDWQDKHANAKDFSGSFRTRKAEGAEIAGTFVVQGEHFRLVYPDKEVLGDGTYLWEINHLDHRIKRRHYDPYEAPAVVQMFRLVRLDMTSEVIGFASVGSNVVYIDIETGSSVAQGNHALDIDPKTLEATGIRTHINQGGWLEYSEIGQLKLDQGFQPETFTCDPANFKKKGYTFVDMAKGENLTVLPEERALLPLK
jgi:outer membrane lipoprotein-sorting protein